MNEMFDLVIKNREWVFSGIGVFILSGIFAAIRLATRRTERTITDDRRSQPTKPQFVLELHERDPNAAPFMFMLPNGETVDPFKVDRISVSSKPLYNVTYWVGNYGNSIFASISRAEALRVAQEVTDGLNRARGYRVA